MEYYDRIKELRVDRDLTQQQVADYLGTRQEYYSKYELGKRQLPLHHLKALCTFYNVSADYILGLPKNLYWPRWTSMHFSDIEGLKKFIAIAGYYSFKLDKIETDAIQLKHKDGTILRIESNIVIYKRNNRSPKKWKGSFKRVANYLVMSREQIQSPAEWNNWYNLKVLYN